MNNEPPRRKRRDVNDTALQSGVQNKESPQAAKDCTPVHHKKTNVMRMLEKAGIPYLAVEYEYSDDDLSGVHAAAQIKEISEDQCFKTLVARGERLGPLVFVLPVARELDLKAAAAAAGDKRAELIHVRELPGLTGYLRGGCSPVGMKKKFPTFIDDSALRFDKIGVSAGARGQQVILGPRALGGLVDARFCPLVVPEG